MEVISIDGVEYVRASILARKLRYTSDYIGQLCRSGKVEAKLVGRTWYVNPESVSEHKNARYQKTSSGEKAISERVGIESSRLAVNAVPRSSTVKSIRQISGAAPQYLRRIEWKPVKYELDESELLPPLKRPHTKTTELQVDIADARRVPIKEMTHDASLVAEQLPEIALRGSLKIASADDDFTQYDEDSTSKNIDISSESRIDEPAVHLHPRSTDRKKAVAIHHGDSFKLQATESAGPANSFNSPAHDPYRYDVPVVVERRISLPPTTKATYEEVAGGASAHVSNRLIISLILSFFLISTALLLVVDFVQMTTAQEVSRSYELKSGR